MLVILKTSKLVSKFENPTPGAERPFLQRGRFIDESWKELQCARWWLWSVLPWLSRHLESIATFLAKKFVQMQKGSVEERSTENTMLHLESANSTSITSQAIQWRRLGACIQRLISAVPQLQHEHGGAYRQPKAFQTSRLSPNSHLFPNKTMTYGSVYRVDICLRKVWMVRATWPGACKKGSFANEETCKEHPGR